MRKLITTILAGLIGSAAHAQASDPVRIVGAVDLSGAAADVGRDALAGAKFAVEQINGQGGVLGRKVVLDHQDSGSNPQRAITQANALLQGGAAFLLAPQSSATALAVSKAVTARQKVPTCVGTSIIDDLTMKDFNPYVFSVTPTSYMEAYAQAARFAKMPYKRYALLSADYAGGRAGVSRFREVLQKLNPQAEIVVEEYPKFGARDYTASINKILAARPDYVFSILFGADLLTFSRQAGSLGFFKNIDNRFIALYDFNTLKAMGGSAPIGTEGWQRAPANYLSEHGDAGRALVDSYRAKNGEYPSDWTLMTYDCVMNWAQAANAAKSIEPDAVMKQIETGEFASARGGYRFGAYDHQAEVPVYFGKVAQADKFGQAVLDIQDVVPGTDIRPDEQTVKSMRN
jgi:branched-chain amino acid transport system substrate-binding protein